MITLEKFNYMVNEDAEVTLRNARTRTNVYIGRMSDIPLKYSGCEVMDFTMDPNANITFIIRIKENREIDRSWHEGCTRVGKSIYHFWVKTADEDSDWGIEGGKVIKAMLRRGDEIVCNYDREWVLRPVDDETETALAIAVESSK